jgi:hypothetical protein
MLTSNGAGLGWTEEENTGRCPCFFAAVLIGPYFPFPAKTPPLFLSFSSLCVDAGDVCLHSSRGGAGVREANDTTGKPVVFFYYFCSTWQGMVLVRVDRVPRGAYWARICKRLRSPGIDSDESILPVYVAWRTGTTNRIVVPGRQAGNRFLGSLIGLQIRALNSCIHSSAFLPGWPNYDLRSCAPGGGGVGRGGWVNMLVYCIMSIIEMIQANNRSDHLPLSSQYM